MYAELLGYDTGSDEHTAVSWFGDINLPDDCDSPEWIQKMASYLEEEGGMEFDRLWIFVPDYRCVAGAYHAGLDFGLKEKEE